MSVRAMITPLYTEKEYGILLDSYASMLHLFQGNKKRFYEFYLNTFVKYMDEENFENKVINLNKIINKSLIVCSNYLIIIDDLFQHMSEIINNSNETLIRNFELESYFELMGILSSNGYREFDKFIIDFLEKKENGLRKNDLWLVTENILDVFYHINLNIRKKSIKEKLKFWEDFTDYPQVAIKINKKVL